MAENITVKIEHRAEGYLLRLGIPRHVIEHLASGEQMGMYRDDLERFVPLNNLPKVDDFDRPQLVRIEIDVIPHDVPDR